MAPTTRERIVDAAITCFGERGVEATSLEAVAQAAGVHRVTLHRIFPGGRHELIVEVLDRAAERMARRVREIVAASPSAAEAAIEAASHVVLEARRDPALSRALGSLEAQRAVLSSSSSSTQLHDIVTELWGLVSARAAATGEWVVDDDEPALLPGHWARVLLSLVSNPVGVETPEELRRYLRVLVVPALVGPPGSATAT